MTCVIAENHAVLKFGLKSARTTRLIGEPPEMPRALRKFCTSLEMAVLRWFAPLPACATAVASTLI